MKGYCATSLFVLLALATAPGCGDSCPEPLELVSFGVCACAGNQVFDTEASTCGCPPNTVLEGQNCVCEDGFVEDAAGLCLPDGVGASCTLSDDCVDPNFPFCFTVDATTRYCTFPDCLEDTDCPTNWQCLDDGTARLVCQRPPSGVGLVCDVNADCGGLEASFCDPINKVCRVADCTPEPGSCFGNLICCDIRDAPFEAPDTVCVTPEEAGAIEVLGATCGP